MSTNGKVSSLLTSIISCEQTSFHSRVGSLQLTRQIHEEHYNTNYDLPNMLLLPSRVIYKPKYGLFGS